MPEFSPKHTPGQFNVEAVPDSKDVHITSEDQQIVARVFSRGPEQPNAPSDEVMLHNAALFKHAPTMHHLLDTLLDREHEPMHPMIADAARDLLREIDAGCKEAVMRNRESNEFRSRLREFARDNAPTSREERPKPDEGADDEDSELNFSF